MVPIELTQIQANRWDRHIKDGRNAAGGNGKPISPEREHDAIATYQKHGSLSYVTRELHMGRDTFKQILKTNGVPL